MKPKHLFRKTLLQLTAQYTLLLFIMFSVFSGAVYIFADHTFGGDYTTPNNLAVHETSDPALDRLRNILLFSDACLVVILPFISYWLAKRALLPVQKSYAEQQKFVDNASHELRTPLSIVQGELELAVQKPRTQQVYVKAIQTSLDEVNSLNNLVAELLLFARGPQSNIERLFDRIEIGSIVETSVQEYKQIYKAKGLKFYVDVKDCEINGSAELIARCAANVLDNACKYSKPGGKIEVGLDQSNGSVKLTVSDHGIGMTSKELNNVYKRFWRADEARTVRGHGLGLAIVKRIVELHHGIVDITSAKDKGTTAVISLPKHNTALSR